MQDQRVLRQLRYKINRYRLLERQIDFLIYRLQNRLQRLEFQLERKRPHRDKRLASHPISLLIAQRIREQKRDMQPLIIFIRALDDLLQVQLHLHVRLALG